MLKYQHMHIVTFAAVLFMRSSAFAWGAKGHQTVALILNIDFFTVIISTLISG